MRFLIVLVALVAAVSAQFVVNSGQYNPGKYNPQKYDPFKITPYKRPQYNPYFSSTPAPIVYNPTYATPTLAPVPKPVKVYNADAPFAQIVKSGNEISPDGSYNYFYETQNGITAQEQGTPRVFGGNPPAVADVAQGSFSYTSPEGIPFAVSYIADENGFQPIGDHLPKVPEIPPQIARALAYIASAKKL